jgi:hypothetical protein
MTEAVPESTAAIGLQGMQSVSQKHHYRIVSECGQSPHARIFHLFCPGIFKVQFIEFLCVVAAALQIMCGCSCKLCVVAAANYVWLQLQRAMQEPMTRRLRFF